MQDNKETFKNGTEYLDHLAACYSDYRFNQLKERDFDAARSAAVSVGLRDLRKLVANEERLSRIVLSDLQINYIAHALVDGANVFKEAGSDPVTHSHRGVHVAVILGIAAYLNSLPLVN